MRKFTIKTYVSQLRETFTYLVTAESMELAHKKFLASDGVSDHERIIGLSEVYEVGGIIRVDSYSDWC